MTARINLLPWRQRHRDRQRRAFFAQLGGTLGVSVLLVLLWTVALDRQTKGQDARNRFLLAGIDEFDRRIGELEVVRRRRDETNDRIEALAGLRHDRAGTVRVLDELARTIAPGIHYTSVVKRGAVINAHGIARSNNDISTLMRNLADSERFEAPKLKGIEEGAVAGSTEQAAVFEITFAASIPARQGGGP